MNQPKAAIWFGWQGPSDRHGVTDRQDMDLLNGKLRRSVASSLPSNRERTDVMRPISIAGAPAALAALALSLPSSAQAAALGTITWNGTSLSQTTLTADVGDTFVVSSSSNVGIQARGPVSSGGTSCATPNVACTVSLGGGSKTYTVTGSGNVLWDNGGTVATLTITSGGGNSSSGSGSSPAPVVQEFGKPASGTCDAAQPAGLDWAGVPSGGWANSWSQWMNGGSGGFVCTRTLVYSTTQVKWVLA